LKIGRARRRKGEVVGLGKEASRLGTKVVGLRTRKI
jgi:hypothetical protein